eukprot:3001884-Prorocentrum_lima.AAC.1
MPSTFSPMKRFGRHRCLYPTHSHGCRSQALVSPQGLVKECGPLPTLFKPSPVILRIHARSSCMGAKLLSR